VPTAEYVSIWSTCTAAPLASSSSACSSVISAGLTPIRRANRLAARARRTAWNCDRAASVVSAAVTLTPAITYGSASCADGLNSLRYAAIASSSASGAKCDANAYGSPYAPASCAPNSDEPRM